jgi:molecular chaperone DnaK (HSP70)
VVGIPTNSNSNQRFLTLEAFRRAGFQVVGMLNEPSAAGLEYAYRYRPSDHQSNREHLVVYDLGGGTFDTSVISMNGREHEVIGSEGITRLGGDDFDALLMESVLSRYWPSGFIRKRLSLALSGILTPPFGPTVRSSFLNVCREAKEALNPNTRKIMVDLSQVSPALDTVLVPISVFYEKCDPLIAQTIQATKQPCGERWENVSQGMSRWPPCIWSVVPVDFRCWLDRSESTSADVSAVRPIPLPLPRWDSRSPQTTGAVTA